MKQGEQVRVELAEDFKMIGDTLFIDRRAFQKWLAGGDRVRAYAIG